MTQQLLIKSTTAAWYMTQNANQVLYSTVLDNAVWAATTLTVAGGQTDPDAGTNAYRLTASAANATLLQPLTLKGGSLNRVLSVYLKRITGTGNIQLTLDNATFTTVAIDGTWARYDLTDVISGTADVGIRIVTSGDAVDAAFVQFEDGATATTYAVNAANRYTVTQITDADYPENTVRGCAFLDGRFFVMTPKGEIYQSGLEDAATWSALEFIQSQNDPSNGVFLAKAQNHIVAFKQWSIEFFYDAANAVGSILAPVMNMAVQIGCASDGSVQDIGAGGLIFMGQTRNGFGRAIYLLSGGTPQKISSPATDKYLDQDDLAVVHSWFANVGSHALYGITLVTTGKTLVYDLSTQQWSFFTYLQDSSASKTITAITAEGVATSTAHGLTDGAIVKVSATNADFNGWHVVTAVTANTFTLQATGTAFSGSGTAAVYTETYFPVVASVRANGRQYMQDKSSGALYEFSMDAYTDAVGAIASRIRTPKLDGDAMQHKFMAQAELIGDKIDSVAVIRYTDDDYSTYSNFKQIDLSVNRSRVRRLGKYNRRAFEILHLKDRNLRLSAIEFDD